MLRDYEIVSPSLEGILNDDSLTYEGLKRPSELLRVLDGPAAKDSGPKSPKKARNEEDRHVLEAYFNDLYGVFMKKLSHFVTDSDPAFDEGVKLLALLQEMIKIKKLVI